VVDDEPGVAVIGRRVTIRDIDGIESTYSLVLPGDGDPMQGWVSSDSPLGAALTGRRAADEVDVVAPAGSWRATIVAVE
jgi:transcription elongation factor GreA